MQRKFKRQISSLSQIFSFVSEFLTSYQVDESILFSINLAIEELFTNIVKYNRTTNSDITIDITKVEEKIIAKVIDHNCDEFDVSKTQEVDITRRLEERKVGGLGLHLVKKMVDDIKYEYSNGESRITFTKNLE
ncbi:MAG: ATP-binding protein [Bacteroidota bacterium]|nr:ATP-binding protein [Bacteroidota bacterium]